MTGPGSGHHRVFAGVSCSVWLLAALAAWCCSTTEVSGADAETPRVAPSETLQFRRVFVPDEALSKLALDGWYLPVRRDDFEKLVRSAAKGQSGMGGALQNRITQATYTARLTGTQRLEGEAQLQIVHQGERESSLVLEPCNLVIRESQWRAAESSAASGEAVASSLRPRIGFDERGQFTILVSESGTLDLSWVLRSLPDSTDSPSFVIRLPECPLTRILLDLPHGLQPLVSHGFVTRETESSVEESWNRWALDVGGHASLFLRIAPLPGDGLPTRELLLRQKAVYRFSPQDVDLTVDLHLDILNEPLSHLAIAADPALRVVEMTYGGRELRWTEDLAEGHRKLLLELPEPLIGLDHRFRFRAVASVELGQTWALPGVSVDQGMWSQGTVRLEFPESLELAKLTTRGCRQTGLLPASVEGFGESVTLECFDPQAEITVVLDVPREQIQVRRGTTIHLGTNRSSLVDSAHFTTTGPPRFELTLATPWRWNVDQIESQPPEVLEEWSSAGRSGTFRLIQIRLREPLAPDRPLSLIVSAHGDGLRSGDKLTGEALRWGDYLDTWTVSHLFALNAEPPFQIRLDGDGQLERLTAAALDADQQTLIAVSPNSVLFREGPGMDQMAVDLRSEPPDYAVRIDVECEAGERKVDLLYRIRVQPKTSAIDRLQVHFSGPPEQALTWTHDGGEQPLVARRLPPDGSVGIGSGEIWQISLPEPRDVPFEVQARQTVDFEGETSLPLAALPGATSQVGTVTIRSADALMLRLAVQNVRAIPAEPLSAGQYSTTRAVYRYDPSQDCRITLQQSSPAAPRPMAWVWSCDLVTRHYRDGKTLHVAEYQVEDCGASQMLLTTSYPVEWLSARVDGREVPLGRDAALSTRLNIPLPRAVRFPIVRVRYVVHGNPLGSFGSIAATWPDCDQQVFRRSWVAWLPPGFASLPESPSPTPESWHRQLFGSLLRPPETGPFLPLSRDSWRAWFHPADQPVLPSDWQEWSHGLNELWAEYQRLLDSASEQSPITWGGLLRVWQTSDEVPSVGPSEFWIDQLALGAEGISAQSLVQAPVVTGHQAVANVSETTRGSSLLASAGLALLTDGSRVLVTTVRGLFDRSDAVALPGLPHVFALSTIDTDLLLAQEPKELRWTRLESWIDQAPLPQACWRHAGIPSLSQSGEIAGDSGWTVQRIPTAAFQAASLDWNKRSRIAIYRPHVIQSLGWAAFLTSLGLTVWVLRGYLPLIWPLAGTAGAMALLAPSLWAPVFQCLFLGTVLGGLVALARAARLGRSSPLPEREELPTTSLFVQALALLVLLTGLAGYASEGRGAEPAAARAPEATKVYQILSPIDEHGDPLGEYVYVPSDFYEALLRKASPAAVESPSWMIYDATYQATMNWNATEEKLSVIELSATYDLEVFQSGAVVRLPMIESQAHLLPNRVSVDGQPATLRWLDGDGGLALDIDSIGRYRVALAFRPHVLRNGDFDRFEVAIPRVANSRLRIELPSEIREVSFPTALGTSVPDLGVGNWLVQLGPTERLVARWPNDVDPSSLPEIVELDQLMWLRVGLDAVQLDARLRFSQFVAPITRVNLMADHRLRLLPPSDDAPIAWYESTRGPTQIIHLEFKPPHQQELEIDLSFILDETASIGNIRLPKLSSSADRLRRQWLAVTVDPALVCQAGQPSEQDGLAPNDFLGAWGAAGSPPQFVIDLKAANPPSSLTVHPPQPQGTAQQRTKVVCRPGSAEFVLQADLNLVQGARWQYEIDLPSSVTVDRVTVDEAGQSRLRSWMRNPDGRLVLRLDQPVEQPHRLRVDGRLEVTAPPRGDLSLEIPDWSIGGMNRLSQHVDVYRHEQVQIRVAESEGYQVREDFVDGSFSPGRGRWVVALAIDPEVAEPRLKLVSLRNRPRTTGQMVTAVRREPDGWWAEVDLHLSVAGGVLDFLRMEIPADWKGPFQIPEGMTAELSDLPGKGRCYLLLRPEQAVRGDFQVQFRGPISSASRERIRVPDIVLLDAERIEAFVLMPTKVDQQRIVWERSGLQAKPLPEPLRPLRGPADLPYGTIRPRFQATIKDIQLESGLAFVRLADHCLDWDYSGRILGVSTFDLEPAGRNECRLSVPEGFQLLHVTVADLTVLPLLGEDQHLRVPLGPQQLAQRIQVLFSGRIENGSGNSPIQSLRVPILQGLPVEQTCWTIRHHVDARWEFVSTESLTNPEDLDWLRVRNLAGLIAKAEEVLKDGDPEEIVRWYVPWARRWSTVRSRLNPVTFGSAGSREQAGKELADFDENHRRIAERLGVQAHALLAGHEARRAFETSDVWRIAANPQHVTKTRITAGPSAFPQIRRAEQPRSPGNPQIAALSMLAGLTLLAMLLLPHPSLDEPLRRHPEILGVVLGAVWWWAFAASAVGLLVFSTCLVCFVIRAVKRRRRRLAIASL